MTDDLAKRAVQRMWRLMPVQLPAPGSVAAVDLATSLADARTALTLAEGGVPHRTSGHQLDGPLELRTTTPRIRTRIGPNPPHKPASHDTWLWSRCWDCDWYVAHLEERHAMEHTIEVAEHRCEQVVQLDLFGGAA